MPNRPLLPQPHTYNCPFLSNAQVWDTPHFALTTRTCFVSTVDTTFVGTYTSSAVPCPNRPLLPQPHVYTDPPSSTQAEWRLPACTCRTGCNMLISVGIVLSWTSGPTPNRPFSLLPQPYSFPSFVRANTWVSPQDKVLTRTLLPRHCSKNLTGVGTRRLNFEAWPN
jgi:hypothetical protein